MFQINVYNKISDKGLSRFEQDRYQLVEDKTDADAILLRSFKLKQEHIPDSVKAIARAGAGVNNVPVEECTEKGVVVFNTPGANANAVKELVLAGMLLGSRGIVPGMDYAQSLHSITDANLMNQQLEAEKKRFAGSELAGKTLGVVGLGAIGSLVAQTALALDMDVVGYDPAISIEAAWRLPSQVRKMESVEALFACSDYISLHVPAIDATRGMVNAQLLSQIKTGAVLLNFARGAIVNPEDIVASLNQNQLGQYICDFPEPVLLGHDRVFAMPHIGASTKEAEENCAVMAANQLKDYLENGNIKNSVNFPAVSMPRAGDTRITFTNHNVSGVLGEVLSVFTKHQVNVVDMINKSRGEIAYNVLDVDGEVGEEVLAEIDSLEHVIALRVL